jgi:prepilin-type N-terminal cleavage/methylation domain-containing protein
MMKRGQSLIELLIAMTVIVVGLAAVSTMIFSNLRLQERSADRLIGANLAREGVELAKSVRDSNWMAGGATTFDQGLSTGTDYTGVPRVVNGNFVGFSFTPDTLDADQALLYQTAWGSGSDGLLVQGPGASGTASPFRRLLTLSPICSDYTTRSSGSQCNPLTQIGIRVTSQVRWTKRGYDYYSTVEDDLFDWR